jgi:hypothetical protein
MAEIAKLKAIVAAVVAPRAGSRRSGSAAPPYGHPDFGKRRCACNDFDCGWKGTVAELGCEFEKIPDLNQRCAPGEIVPVGECPKCHALAQLTYSE